MKKQPVFLPKTKQSFYMTMNTPLITMELLFLHFSGKSCGSYMYVNVNSEEFLKKHLID